LSFDGASRGNSGRASIGETVNKFVGIMTLCKGLILMKDLTILELIIKRDFMFIIDSREVEFIEDGVLLSI
jgi:hypothetical protein